MKLDIQGSEPRFIALLGARCPFSEAMEESGSEVETSLDSLGCQYAYPGAVMSEEVRNYKRSSRKIRVKRGDEHKTVVG